MQEEIKEINVGDVFVCIKDLYLLDKTTKKYDEEICYNAGMLYFCVIQGCIENNFNDANHRWSCINEPDCVNAYFKKFKDAKNK